LRPLGFGRQRSRPPWPVITWRRRASFVVVACSVALIFVAVAVAGYYASVQTAGPEAYLRLGEASGTSAADATGHGHAGTYFGSPTLGVAGGLAGDSDTAIQLSGSGKYARVAYSSALQASTFTVEALVNPASLVSSQGVQARPIVAMRTASMQQGYMLYQDGYTAPQFAFIVGTGTNLRWVYQISGLPIAINTWYHVVGTYDGVVVRIYVNGVDVSGPQKGGGSFVPLSTSQPFNIGRCDSCSGTVHYWQGKLDEVAYYPRALSASEVAQHYAAVTAPPDPVNTNPPTIFGSLENGVTLTADTGTWTGAPTSYNYQWEACQLPGSCEAIPGATSSTLDLTDDEVDQTIRVDVTATNAAGSTLAYSAETSTVTGTRSPPLATYSYYVTVSSSTSDWQSAGAALADLVDSGSRPKKAIVILHFGSPKMQGSTYGTWLPTTENFVSIPDAQAIAYAFAYGYYVNVNSGPHLNIVLAINNDALASDLSAAHGAAWASMVNNLNSQFSSNCCIASQVNAFGGGDFEVDYSEASSVRTWISGYSASSYWRLVVDAGADACPTTSGYGDCSAQHHTWTTDDVWWVTWGSVPSWPFPQIYSSVADDQWYWIDKYSIAQGFGSKMAFMGALSQRAACDDTSNSCDGTYNAPATSWTNLYDRLASDADTKIALPYVSNVRWNLVP
jgi:hypothetical protein